MILFDSILLHVCLICVHVIIWLFNNLSYKCLLPFIYCILIFAFLLYFLINALLPFIDFILIFAFLLFSFILMICLFFLGF